MARCLTIRPGGGIGDSVIQNHRGGYRDEQFSGSVALPILSVKLPNHRLSTAVNAKVACDSALSLFDGGSDLGTRRVGTSTIESPRVSVSEKLDEWMRNSVTEIVKNIKQAPLLVQIYADGQVQTKKALPENVSKHRLSSLEGVILVEELDDPAEEDGGTRAFGVLIQGRVKGKNECKSTCYLLKTSSVNGGGGLGHICTHFCLMKVQSFHKDAFSQFNDCWLLR
ncbi:hypothetical protein SSX86_003729 [Deinandra increscens subsp. villosa]|uniref:DUF7804 domain-containing protein n=1 Tax=Deinandra increscens subsp. villosa TaxID=3103831 RepID=A0AAP0H847_9ASTR